MVMELLAFAIIILSITDKVVDEDIRRVLSRNPQMFPF